MSGDIKAFSPMPAPAGVQNSVRADGADVARPLQGSLVGTNPAVPKGPAGSGPSTLATTPAGDQVQFSIEPATDQLVVQIVDGSNLEVIRKFPTEETSEVVKDVTPKTGLFINAKA